MPKIEKKYLLAKSDYHAQTRVQQIYTGKIRDYSKVLYDTRQKAVNQLQRYPLGQQELYEIYETPFDKRLIRYG